MKRLCLLLLPLCAALLFGHNGANASDDEVGEIKPLEVLYFGKENPELNNVSEPAGNEISYVLKFNRKIQQADVGINGKLYVRLNYQRMQSNTDVFQIAMAPVRLDDAYKYWQGEVPPGALQISKGRREVKFSLKIDSDAAQPPWGDQNGAATPLEFPEYTLITVGFGNQVRAAHMLTTSYPSSSASESASSSTAPNKAGGDDSFSKESPVSRCSGEFCFQGVSENGNIQDALDDAVEKALNHMSRQGCADIPMHIALMDGSIELTSGGITGASRLTLWISAEWPASN